MRKIHIGIMAAAAIVLSGCGGGSGSKGDAEVAGIDVSVQQTYSMEMTKNENKDVSRVHVVLKEEVKNPSTSIQKTLYIKGVSNLTGYYQCDIKSVSGLPAIIKGQYKSEPQKIEFDVDIDTSKHCKNIRYIVLSGGYKLVSTTNGGTVYKKWQRVLKNPDYKLNSKYDFFPVDYSSEIVLPKYHKETMSFFIIEAEHPEKELDIKELTISSKNGNVVFYQNGQKKSKISINNARINKVSFDIEGAYIGKDFLLISAKMQNGDTFSKEVPIEVAPPQAYNVSFDPENVEITKGEEKKLSAIITGEESPDRPVVVKKIKIRSEEGNVLFKIDEKENFGTELERNVNAPIHNIDFVVKGMYTGEDTVYVEFYTANAGLVSGTLKVLVDSPLSKVSVEPESVSIKRFQTKTLDLAIFRKNSPDKPIKLKSLSLSSKEGNVAFIQPYAGKSINLSGNLQTNEEGIFVNGSLTTIKLKGVYVGNDEIVMVAELENGVKIRRKIPVSIAAAEDVTLQEDPVSTTTVEKGSTGKLVLNIVDPESPGKPLPVSSVMVTFKHGKAEVASIVPSNGQTTDKIIVTYLGKLEGNDEMFVTVNFANGNVAKYRTAINIEKAGEYSLEAQPDSVDNVGIGQIAYLHYVVKDIKGRAVNIESIKVFKTGESIALYKPNNNESIFQRYAGTKISENEFTAKGTSNVKDIYLKYEGEYGGQDTIGMDIKFADGTVKREYVTVKVSETNGYNMQLNDLSKLSVKKGEKGNISLTFIDPDSKGKPVKIKKLVLRSLKGNIAFSASGTPTLVANNISAYKLSEEFIGKYTGTDTIEIVAEFQDGNTAKMTVQIEILNENNVAEINPASAKALKVGKEGSFILNFISGINPDKAPTISKLQIESEKGNVLIKDGNTYKRSILITEDFTAKSKSFIIFGKYAGNDTLNIYIEFKDGSETRLTHQISVTSVTYGAEISDLSDSEIGKGESGSLVLKFIDSERNGAPVAIKYLEAKAKQGNVEFNGGSKIYTVSNVELTRLNIPFKGIYSGQETIDIKIVFANDQEIKLTFNVQVTPLADFVISPEIPDLKKLEVETIKYRVAVAGDTQGEKIPDIDSVTFTSESGKVVFMDGSVEKNSLTVHPGTTDMVAIPVKGKLTGEDVIVAKFIFANGRKKEISSKINIVNYIEDAVIVFDGYNSENSVYIGNSETKDFVIRVFKTKEIIQPDGTTSKEIDVNAEIAINKIIVSSINGLLQIKEKDVPGAYSTSLTINAPDHIGVPIKVLGSGIGSDDLEIQVFLADGKTIIKKFYFKLLPSTGAGTVSIEPLYKTTYNENTGLFEVEFNLILKDRRNGRPLPNRPASIGLIVDSKISGNSGELENNTFKDPSMPSFSTDIGFGDFLVILPHDTGTGIYDNPKYLGGWKVTANGGNELLLEDAYQGAASNLIYYVGSDRKSNECAGSLDKAYIYMDKEYTDENGNLKFKIAYPPSMIAESAIVFANADDPEGGRIGNAKFLYFRGIHAYATVTYTGNPNVDNTACATGATCDVFVSFAENTETGLSIPLKMKYVSASDFISEGCDSITILDASTGCNGEVKLRVQSQAGQECKIYWRGYLNNVFVK